MSLGGIIGGVIGGVIGFFVGGPVGAAYGFGIGFGVGMMVDPMTPDAQTPGLPNQDLQLTSNTIGTPIFDCLGTVKISQTTLLCYGKERTVTMYTEAKGGKGGGGSRKQATGYQYYMSWVVGICLGPVDAVLTIFKDEKILWSGMVTRPASGGLQAIPIENFGTIQFYFGTDDQVANSKIGEIIGDATLNSPYRGLCFAFMDDCLMGNYNRMPSMRFVVQKFPVLPFSSNNAIQVYDYNPIHGIWYILAKMTGLSEDWLNSTDFATAASVVAAEFHGTSILFANQAGALSYIETINDHIFSILRYGSDAKFHPKLIRDDYDVATLPLVDESVLLDDPSIDRKSWTDTINELKVEYSKVANRGASGGDLYVTGEIFNWQRTSAYTVFKAAESGKLFTYLSRSYGAWGTGYTPGNIMAIDNNMALWVYGMNSKGQLGLGNKTNQYGDNLLHCGSAADWKMVTTGLSHSLGVRGDNNQLYACGDNANGALGLGDTNDRSSWTPVPGMNGVVSVAAANNKFSAVVKSDGSLWTCGFNESGALGLYDNNESHKYLTFQQVTQETTAGGVKRPSANWEKCCAGLGSLYGIKADGSLWAAGTSHYAFEISYYDPAYARDDIAVRYFQPADGGNNLDVVSIETTSNYGAAVVTKDGEVWAIGTGEFYIFGHGASWNTWQKITLPAGCDKIVKVRGSVYHSLLLSNTGKVYVAGTEDYNESYGSLGIGVGAGQQQTYIELDLDFLVGEIGCSTGFSVIVEGFGEL